MNQKISVSHHHTTELVVESHIHDGMDKLDTAVDTEYSHGCVQTTVATPGRVRGVSIA